MKAKAPSTKAARNRPVVFSMAVSKHVFDILTDYRLRHLPARTSAGDTVTTLP